MTTPPRPDQEQSPPTQVIAPGGNAGVFRGRLIIVNGVTAPPGSGIFVYNNAGALIGSWVGAPGTDPIDHESVALGLTVQSASGTLQANLQSGSLTLTKLSGVLAPPSVTVDDDTLNSGNTPSVIESVGVVTLGISTYNPVLLDGTGETWHTVTLDAGWTQVRPVRYKLLAEQNVVYMEGAATHAAFTGGTNLASGAHVLPAFYRPLANVNIGAPGIPSRAGLEITTAGVLVAEPNGTSCTEMDVNGLYPLD